MSKPYIRASLRQAVFDRAQGCCEYCRSQARYGLETFSVEHVLPLAHGGKTEGENLALACQGCNNHKYTKTASLDPVSGALSPLFNPREQNWDEHFSWSKDFSRIVGLTDTGRATVLALRLNRSGVVNLRHALYRLGEHPPTVMID